jgi:hypothetical protein
VAYSSTRVVPEFLLNPFTDLESNLVGQEELLVYWMVRNEADLAYWKPHELCSIPLLIVVILTNKAVPQIDLGCYIYESFIAGGFLDLVRKSLQDSLYFP